MQYVSKLTNILDLLDDAHRSYASTFEIFFRKLDIDYSEVVVPIVDSEVKMRFRALQILAWKSFRLAWIANVSLLRGISGQDVLLAGILIFERLAQVISEMQSKLSTSDNRVLHFIQISEMTIQLFRVFTISQRHVYYDREMLQNASKNTSRLYFTVKRVMEVLHEANKKWVLFC